MCDRQKLATEPRGQSADSLPGLRACRDHAEVPTVELVSQLGKLASVYGLIGKQLVHDLGATLLLRARPVHDLRRVRVGDLRLHGPKQCAHRT